MSTIKLKQTDIENIVKTLVNEQMGSQEEKPLDDVENQSVKELTLFQDAEGNLYALDDSNPKAPKITPVTRPRRVGSHSHPH